QGACGESTLADGTVGYHYSGESLGSFGAGRQLALPNENRVVGGGASYEPAKWFSVRGEMAASTSDPNRLSAVGDATTQGSAGLASLRASPTLRWGGVDRGRIEANLDWNRRDVRFFAPARQDSAFYQEDWGTDERDPLTGREVSTGGLRYLVGAFSLGGEAGRLSADDGFSARRLRGMASWSGALLQQLRVD